MPSEIDIFRDYMQQQEDVVFGQPTTEQAISEFEMKYNVKLPSDIKEYFLKINGVYYGGGFIAVEALSHWCLLMEHEDINPQEVSKVIDEADKSFRFGNYDILVWDWFVRLDSNPDSPTSIFVLFTPPTLKGYDTPIKIADNFTDFLQKYRTKNPATLLGYD